jgi:Ras-related protein Rab-8A
LIGNKTDWEDKRVITEKQGRELADELGIMFMETSAKLNQCVNEAFYMLARWVSVIGIDCSPSEVVISQANTTSDDGSNRWRCCDPN